jgi:hypothetical protein
MAGMFYKKKWNGRNELDVIWALRTLNKAYLLYHKPIILLHNTLSYHWARKNHVRWFLLQQYYFTELNVCKREVAPIREK